MSTIQKDNCRVLVPNKSRAPGLVLVLMALTTGIFVSENLSAAINCDDSREPTTFHILVNPEVQNLPERFGYPGAKTAYVKSITVQWPSTAFPERAYMSEVFSIDYESGNISLIDGIDGRARAENPDIRALAEDHLGLAETGLLDSNFDFGLINVEACMDAARTGGLVFVVYESDSEEVGFQAAPFTVKDFDGKRVSVVAPNEGSSDQVGLEFNSNGADIIMEIMEEASGTDSYDMARVNAENIYQETIVFTLNAENERNAKFGDPESAIVHSDKVIILGEYAAVRVAEGVTVYRNGSERRLFDSRVISGLRGYLDFHGKAILELEVAGYMDRRVIQLLEGDTTLLTETSDCTETSRISAEFRRASPLKGQISIYDDGELLVRVEDDLDEVVNCDGSVYTLVGERLLTGVDIPAREYLDRVFNNPNRVLTIVGLDTNGDGKADRVDKDQDGILDGDPISIGCNDSAPRKDYLIMDPPIDERTYTFSGDNAPDGWEVIDPNIVQYSANCADVDKTVTPKVIANDGNNEKGLTISYTVTD